MYTARKRPQTAKKAVWGARFCRGLLAQLIGQSGDLSLGGIVQGTLDGDGGVGKGQGLAVLEHLAHDLGGHRCPRTVLDEGNGAVLVVALGQVVDEVLHEGEKHRRCK